MTHAQPCIVGATAVLAALAVVPAHAAFVGLEVERVDNPFSLVVCDVYAVFDDPQDQLTAGFGDQHAPLSIEVIGGTFVQHQFGFDIEPVCALLPVLPELEFDSYVTIGLPCHTQGETSSTALSAGWSGFGPSALACDDCAWFNPPSMPQTFAGEDLRVRLGRFTTADGEGFQGSLTVSIITGGKGSNHPVEFIHLACADTNDDGVVNVTDLVKVIVCWGTDDPQADLDDDGAVGVDDLNAVITGWGVCP